MGMLGPWVKGDAAPCWPGCPLRIEVCCHIVASKFFVLEELHDHVVGQMWWMHQNCLIYADLPLLLLLYLQDHGWSWRCVCTLMDMSVHA